MRSKLGSARRLAPALLLSGVLLGSFALRVWGSNFGLPDYTRYHPDEHALVERAAAILWTGDWNLGRFNYPPFYAYLQTIAYAAYFLWGAAQGLWDRVMPFTLPQYYHIGRLVTVTFGTLTVLVVYLSGRQLYRRRVGLLAAALLGGCYLHIIHSHYATFDIMLGFLVSLVLLFSELLRTRRETTRWYFLAGLCAGLAGATKYNGAVVVLIPLIAHVLVTPWGEWGWLNGKLFLGVGAFFVGFWGGNPFALGNMTEFLNGLATVLHHYGTQQPGFEGTGNWRWYQYVFLTSADAPWVVAGVTGLLGLAWRDWRKGLLLLIFPLTYYLLASRFVVRFERNMVPLLPFLALGGGWLLDRVADWAANHLRRSHAWSEAMAALGACLLCFLPVAAGISFDVALGQVDHRQIAGEWIQENIEWGSKIAIEHYSIPFDHTEYWVQDVIRISDHNMDWYKKEKFDLIVISDGVWELLHDQPETYAAQLAVYNDLVSKSTLLAEFVPEPPALAVAGYPTVSVYHFAPVRIYRLPE
jgi:4-amino-4-deoxy-L-arabinose transferase-like glycosyltransferase